VPTIASARVRSIRRSLLAWWDAGHRDLPWRYPQQGADPYRVWIAEVMLQQTRVAVVVPYFRRFVRRFPTLPSLARARDEEVLAHWSGLGYYARARRLAPAAREAVSRFGGLPPSIEALSELPGFGPYTAGAVASIAFGIRTACVDGNVARVLGRVFRLDGAPARRARERAWALARELVPADRPGDFNQALMELGATVCLPRTPACGGCPVRRICAVRRSGGLPRAAARTGLRPAPVVELACAVVRRGGDVLLVRQPGDGLFGGLWGLPFAAGATPERARRALAQGTFTTAGEVGALSPGRELAGVERVLTHRRLRMRAYECGGAAPLLPGARTMWYRMPPPGASTSRSGALPCIALSTAMRTLMEALPGGQNTLTRRGATV